MVLETETNDACLVNTSSLVTEATHEAHAAVIHFSNQFGALPDDNKSHDEIDYLVDRVMNWAQVYYKTDVIARSLESFFLWGGKFFHDDSVYENRINYFFEKFIFENPQAERSDLEPLTPYARYRAKFLCNEVTEPKHSIKFFESVKQGLFQVLKVKKKHMTVRSFLDSSKYVVQARRGETFEGMEKGQVFQAFLFNEESETYYLGRGMIWHPICTARKLKRFINKKRKESNFCQEELLALLARTQIRLFRHRNVKVELIYDFLK